MHRQNRLTHVPENRVAGARTQIVQTRRRWSRIGASGAVWIAVALFSAGAQAALVAPGSSVLLSGTTASADPNLAGTVVQDVLEPFTVDLGGGNSVNGYVQDRVVRETATGTLDFYYRLFNGLDGDGCPVASGGSIGVASRNGYSGLSTDVNYRIDGLGSVAPSAATRSADGSTVLFGFLSDPIAPGQESRFFFVHTDARSYDNLGTGTLVGFSSSGGFGQTQFSVYVPAPVPLPAAVWTFGSGVLGMLAIALRRRQSAGMV